MNSASHQQRLEKLKTKACALQEAISQMAELLNLQSEELARTRHSVASLKRIAGTAAHHLPQETATD